VLTNALPAASARLGIDYATVAARNPSACHISILGFGHRPPFGGRRVVDAAAQALSGQALAEGGGREPVGCTGGFLDNGTGWLAALGCVATLYQRQTAGHAGSVQAYLLNTSAFVQLFGLTDPPSPGGRLNEDRWGYAADQRLYQTRDGWIAVAATSPARQAFAEALAQAGCPELAPAGVEAVPAGVLLAECDVLSLHLPLTPATRGLLDATRLARMKPGALLVNTSRGGLVDIPALCAALDSGTPGTAALDVFPAEPEVPAALLFRSDVILTPHIAFSSAHSVLELRRRSTEDLLRVLAGVPPLNPVALPGG
jgi:hypothetical protein